MGQWFSASVKVRLVLSTEQFLPGPSLLCHFPDSQYVSFLYSENASWHLVFSHFHRKLTGESPQEMVGKYRGHKNTAIKTTLIWITTELLFYVPQAKCKVSQDPCQVCSISSLETTQSFRHCTGGAGGTSSCHGESRRGPSALLGSNGGSDKLGNGAGSQEGNRCRPGERLPAVSSSRLPRRHRGQAAPGAVRRNLPSPPSLPQSGGASPVRPPPGERRRRSG